MEIKTKAAIITAIAVISAAIFTGLPQYLDTPTHAPTPTPLIITHAPTPTPLIITPAPTPTPPIITPAPTPTPPIITPAPTPTPPIMTATAPAYGYVHVSGTNYGSSQTVHLYIDEYLSDSVYTYSGYSYDFGAVELSEGYHTVEVYGEYDETGNSDSGYIAAGDYEYLTLDIPPAPAYGYVHVSGTNYGSSQTVYLSTDEYLYDSVYTYSGYSYDFGAVELSEGYHTIEVYGEYDETGNSASGYITAGDYEYLTLDIPYPI